MGIAGAVMFLIAFFINIAMTALLCITATANQQEYSRQIPRSPGVGFNVNKMPKRALTAEPEVETEPEFEAEPAVKKFAEVKKFVEVEETETRVEKFAEVEAESVVEAFAELPIISYSSSCRTIITPPNHNVVSELNRNPSVRRYESEPATWTNSRFAHDPERISFQSRRSTVEY